MRKFLRYINKLVYSLKYISSVILREDPILIHAWVKIKYGKIQPHNWGDELNYYLLKALTKRPVFFQMGCFIV